MNSSSASNNSPLRIAVAANFTPVLKELLVEFNQKTQIKTQLISGATGALYLQIKHGASTFKNWLHSIYFSLPIALDLNY